jgi:hypothetical protein
LDILGLRNVLEEQKTYSRAYIRNPKYIKIKKLCIREAKHYKQSCKSIYCLELFMSSRLVIKDAARQLISRIISAGFGFVVTKIMATYL